MKTAATLVPFVLVLFLQAVAQQTPRITPSGIGYQEYLPDGYHSNSNRYPVVIFLHGYKEKGTSSTDPDLVMRDLPRATYVGLPKYVKYGQKYPFILISPQLKSQYGSWPPSFIIEVLNHVKRTLRVDDRRIYLTGLSLGGLGVWKTAGQYPQVFAAIAPICSGGNALDKASAIAREDVAVWAFHGGSDHIVSYRVTTDMVNAINSAPQKPDPLAKVTIFPGMGHIIWDEAYQRTGLLKWMLTIRNGSQASEEPPSNSHPVVTAGADRTITLPDRSVTITGSASDKDGNITSYQWTKVSGGNATLAGAGTPELKVTDLEEGTYSFRLTAKDNDGASDSDDVEVTVKSAANKPPVADAGSDRFLSNDQVTLDGTARDTDGKIASYRWTKISGGSVNMAGSSSASLILSGLAAGTYVFRFQVTDDDGATASDDVTVTVKQQAPENRPPVVSAGEDRSLKLPENSLQISGRATDDDGSIGSLQWTQISGNAATVDGARSTTLTISNLQEGDYVFRFTAADDRGETSSDDVTIHVFREDNSSNRSPSDITRMVSEKLHGDDTDADQRIPETDRPWLRLE